MCLLRLSSLSKSVPHFPQQTLGATFCEIDFVGAPVGLGKIGVNAGAGEYTRLGFSSNLQICLFRISSLSKVEQHLTSHPQSIDCLTGMFSRVSINFFIFNHYFLQHHQCFQDLKLLQLPYLLCFHCQLQIVQ